MAAGVTLSLVREARAQFEKYEQMGLEAVKHTGFVLVAGGLGERLGYSGIKVCLLLPYSFISECITFFCGVFLGVFSNVQHGWMMDITKHQGLV